MQIFRESAFNPEALSETGAKGISQFMPRAQKDMALRNPYDPEQAIPAQAGYLRKRIDAFKDYEGNVVLGIAAYHAGEEGVKKYLTGRDPLGPKTREYVRRILGVELPEYYTPQPSRR
jgi:soluble lytic murein transglycosylase-like protein